MLSIKEYFKGRKIVILILLLIVIALIGAIFKYFLPVLCSSSSLTTPTNEPLVEDDSILVVAEVMNGNTVFVYSMVPSESDMVVGGSAYVSLLGINIDEPGSQCYREAERRLEELVLNKAVLFEKETEDRDQYGRLLRYLIIGSTNINLKLVEEGLAICSFSEPNTKYQYQCAQLEQIAKDNKIGCKWRSGTDKNI